MDSVSVDVSDINDINLNAETFTHTFAEDLYVKDDVYLCGKCRGEFLNIDEFIYHKVEVEKCQLVFCPSLNIKGIMIPKFLRELSVENISNVNNSPKEERPDSRASGKENDNVFSQVNINVNVTPALEMVTLLKCQTCQKTFNRQATLRRHIYYEHSETSRSQSPSKTKCTVNRPKLHVCDVCGAEFKLVAMWKAHQKMHTNSKEFRCKFANCAYTFKTRGSLKRHQRRHTGERPYKCDLCGRKFTESGALTRHMRSRVPCMNKTDADLPRYGKRMEDERLGDLIDGSDSAILDVVEQHLAETTDSLLSVSSATSGDKNCDFNPAVSTSMQLADNSNVQVCNLCDAICSSLEDLKTHLQSHVGKQYFKCGACNWITSERDALLGHIEEAHRALNTGPPHEVEVTVIVQEQQVHNTSAEQDNNKIIVEDSALNSLLPVVEEGDSDEVLSSQAEETKLLNHESLSELQDASQVSGGIQNKCKYCNRTFRCSSYLRLHIRSHTGERPYLCNICNKMFATKDTLRKHMVCHSEERNFKCGVCGKMYKRIAHVREHVRIHTNERPYACSLCNKRFKTTNAMKTHVKTHTDVMPFVCPFCLKSFREKASLRRHIRTHTGEKPFSCQHCGRRFAEHGTLSRHMRAKVPCYQLTTSEVVTQQAEHSLLKEVEAATDGATVLTEFSSVVANAQHYIIQTVADSIAEESQETISAEGQVNGNTSYVILTNESELPEGTIVTKLDGNALLIPALADVNQEQVVAADFSTLVQMEQDKGVGDETQIHGEDELT